MSNIYSAPTADLSHASQDGATYIPSVLELHGRIGRVRYLAYYFSAMFALMLIMGILVALATTGGQTMAMIVTGIVYIPMIVVAVIIGRRRLNDLDKSGWWFLLTLVPLVNIGIGLYMLFARGTDGPNEYGPPPSPNTTLVIVGAWIIPAVFIIGVIAAMALPGFLK